MLDEGQGTGGEKGMLDEGQGTGGEVFGEEVGGAEPDEAGGGAVGAGEPVALGDAAVHHEMDAGGLREDGAEDRGRADLHAGELPKLVGGCERNARNPQSTAELPGNKRFIVRGHIQVEFRLLAVAEEERLHDAHADLRGDVLAVLHREAGVGIHPPKGDAQGGECLIDFPLQFRRELSRWRGHYVADFEHKTWFSDPEDSNYPAFLGRKGRKAEEGS